MKLKHSRALFVGVICSVCSFVEVAHAGLLKSTTGTNITERYCPEVTADFDAYVAKWGEAITGLPDHLGMPKNTADISPADACVFNTQWERYFDDANPGEKTSAQNVQENIDSTYVENEEGDIWLSAELDNTDLALPEAHFVVGSQASERNSVNLFSAQSFLWSGTTTILEFSAIFDFSMSTGMWGSGQNSFYNLQFGASKSMTFGEGYLFPDSWGEELALGAYYSEDDDGIVNQDVNYRNLSISFEVNEGDEFQLWGLSQAFALNGGWVDSANTMRTQLAVAGLDQTASQNIFANSLAVVPSSVPEPSTLIIMTLGLFGLASRRVRTRN